MERHWCPRRRKDRVQATKVGHQPIDDGLDGAAASHIHGQGQGALTVCGNFGQHGIGLVQRQVGNGDRCSGGGQSHGNRTPQATGATGYQSDLTVEVK